MYATCNINVYSIRNKLLHKAFPEETFRLRYLDRINSAKLPAWRKIFCEDIALLTLLIVNSRRLTVSNR